MYAVQSMAEEMGFSHTNLDPNRPEWYLTLTNKGKALLKAYDRFTEESPR